MKKHSILLVLLSVIMAFAQVLDPEAYTEGSAVVVAEGCADAVKDFLAKL